MATLTRPMSRARFGEIVRVASLDALVCVWLFFSAFLFRSDYAFFVNNLAAGGIAAIFAFFGPFAHRWLAWFPMIIAVWVMISPFVLGFTHDAAATWINVTTGIVMFALTAWSGWLSNEAHDEGELPE